MTGTRPDLADFVGPSFASPRTPTGRVDATRRDFGSPATTTATSEDLETQRRRLPGPSQRTPVT